MSKIIAIHQPNYIPWLGFFHKIKSSDCFVILDNVDYQSGNASSITNRCLIKTANGTQQITVPVRKSVSKTIHQILIDNKQPWKKKQLKTISLAYSKSEYYDEIFPIIEKIINNNHEKLVALNIQLIEFICSYLKITTPIKIASGLGLMETDKNLRIIEICEKLNGSIYLSGNGAKKYNQVELFDLHKLKLQYTTYTPIQYFQLYGSFNPKLSVLDALFNCGSATINLLNG